MITEKQIEQSIASNQGNGRSRRRRFVLLGTMTLAMVSVVSLAAFRFAGPGQNGMRGNPEMMKDHLDFMLGRTLDRIDATDEQRQQIQAIVDRQFEGMKELHGDRVTTHDEIAAILSADSIDRGKLEQMRQDKLAKADQVSRKLVDAAVEISEVLEPEQRRQLVEYFQERFE